MAPESDTRRLGLSSAMALVVASMIGVGVFTTAGFQVADLGNAPVVLLAWVVGGVTACCGALAYGELTAALPQNGGEYSVVSRTYHPALGFASGAASFIAGFAAPLAATGIAFERYLSAALDVDVGQGYAGVVLIVAVSVAQALRPHAADLLTRGLTLLKVLLVLGVVSMVFWGETSRLTLAPRGFADAMLSPEFAIGLIFVAYAYQGWNAAAYVAGDIEDPGKNLPRALALGTLLVMVLYVGVHVALLSLAPTEVLAGKVEVADAAARFAFGDTAARVLSGVIAFGLLSTASAMVATGPPIYDAMAKDIPALRLLSSPNGRPTRAIALQCFVALGFILTASFATIVTYVGVTLSFFAGLTVFAVFVLRVREPELLRPYRTWGHPITTLTFLLLTCWMVGYVVWSKPLVGATGGATIVVLTLVGFVVTKRKGTI